MPWRWGRAGWTCAWMLVAGCSLLVNPDDSLPLPELPALSVPTGRVTSQDDVQASFTGVTSWQPAGVSEPFTVTYETFWRRTSGDCATSPGAACRVDGLTLSAASTERDDVWVANVVQTVGGYERAPVQSTITIANALPNAVVAGLNQYQPRADDRLRAYHGGFDDPDGDVDRTRYRWLADGVELACEGASCDLSTLGLSAGQELSLQVIPFDGIDEGTPIELGPFVLKSADVIEVRQRAPVLSKAPPQLFAFDDVHGRILVADDDQLWEYTASLGFVQLHPTGTPPVSLQLEQAVVKTRAVSDTNGKRVLWLGVDMAARFRLFALDVSERGFESWSEIALEDGESAPSARCMASVYLDAEREHLFLAGGLWPCQWADDNLTVRDWQGEAFNELWALDLREQAGEDKPWTLVNGTGLPRTFGATATAYPAADAMLLLGGLTDSNSGTVGDPEDASVQAAPAMRIDFEYTALGDLSRAELSEDGGPFDGEPTVAPAVYTHPQTGQVYVAGGWGRTGDRDPVFLRYSPGEGTYTPATSGPTSSDFRNFGTPSPPDASLNGVGGLMDGKVVLTFGEVLAARTVSEEINDMGRFRVARLAQPDVWDVLFSTARDMAVPAAARVGLDQLDGESNRRYAIFGGGPTTVVGISYDYWGAYDLQLDRWRPLCRGVGECLSNRSVERPSLIAREAGGFFSVGGISVTASPWIFAAGAWSFDPINCAVESCPANVHAVGASLFATGFDDVQFALFSGSSPSVLWLFLINGRWEQVTPPGAALVRLPDTPVAYDGRRYAVMFGAMDDELFEGTRIWDTLTSDGRGYWESPLSVTFADGTGPSFGPGPLLRVADDPPAFVLRAGSRLWFLQEVGERAYRWSQIDGATLPAQPGATLWDAARRRLIIYAVTGFDLYEVPIPLAALPEI